MSLDDRLLSERFPRASQYHPDWVIEQASSGANSLWLTEWLTSAMTLQSGMRVLDLGCGRAGSSIFLHREFGVQVWATDLWFSPAENLQRIRAAGCAAGVFPIHANARQLPFAPDFFDALICVDAFYYFGTDDLYLNYLSQFVRPGGQMGIAGAGLMREFDGPVPAHLQDWWSQDCWCFHTSAWLRRHWERTGLVEVELADTLSEGWRLWLDWLRAVAPDNTLERSTVEADAGEYLGYVRLLARRRHTDDSEPFWSDTTRCPPQYTPKPLLRD